MTKYFKKLGDHLILVCLGLLVFLTFSCNEGNEKKQAKKPWNHKDVMPTKFKWFLNTNNYTDSNYKARFQTYYQEFLAQNQTDSALFCLLTYGEMIDQNYMNDSFWLNTAKAHLTKYEPISTEGGELIKLYYYIGSQYEVLGNYPVAKDWYNKAMNHPKVLPRTKINCMSMIAVLYLHANEAEKALPLQLERLNYFEKEQDTINIGVAYANISNSYNELNASSLALKNIRKAIEYAKLKHDTNTLIVFLSNYFVLTKNDNLHMVYTPSLINELYEFNKICAAYSKLSPYNKWVLQDCNLHYYWKTNKLDSMKITLEQIDKIRKILNNPIFDNKYESMVAHYNDKLGIAAHNEDKLMEMANYFEKNEMPFESFRLNIMLELIAKRKGDYKKALVYNDKIHEFELARINKNNNGKVYEMDVKYQTAKKDQELLIQAEKLKIKQQNIGLLIAGLVIVVLAFVIYLIWQKQKLITEKRKNETLFTQKLMENTEEERMRIAKDLHDSIGHELLSIKNAMINKLQFTEDKIDHVLNEVREISRNLFPVMFEEVGLKISVEQLIEQIIKSEGFFVIGEINYIAGTLDTKAELNIYRIIQEALSNVRKYAQAQSAKVSINQTTDSIDVEIIDNGKGFNVMEVLKQGKAFGLMSINQRCLALKSMANITSNESGTTISFQVKL
ncbi:MAG: sensor histidine kinase [Candidatus Methylacidiphilales bacterium]